MTRFLFVAIAVALGLASGTVAAQDLRTVDVASDEWADCTLSDGTGLYFDELRMVFEPASKLVIKMVPFARSVQMVEAGKTDICVGVYEGDVAKGLYPKYPIDFDDLTVMMRKDFASGFKGEASLKDRKTAWIVDYAYDKYLSVPVKLTEVSDRESGIKMLQTGRVDYYVETKSTIIPALKDMGISEKDFHLDTVKWIKLYVCFVQNDKGKALRAIWDRRMPELLASGALKKAFEKWGFEESYAKLAAIR